MRAGGALSAPLRQLAYSPYPLRAGSPPAP